MVAGTVSQFYHVAGALMVVINAVFLCFYFPFLMVLWSSEFRKITAYRVLFAIGLADCIQLSIHVASSITVIWQLEIPYLAGKLVGATMYSCFCCSMSLYIFLSLSHLVYVIFPNFASSLCTTKLVWAMMTVALSGFVLFFALKCLPSSNYLFDPVSIQWITPTEEAISPILRSYSHWIIATYVGFSAIIYTAIFLHIIIVRNNRTTKREMLIILQTFCSLLCLTLAFIYWEIVNPALQHSSAVPGFVSGLLWTTMNGANPIVYMIINKSLRGGFLRLFHSKKRPKANNTRLFVNRVQPENRLGAAANS